MSFSHPRQKITGSLHLPEVELLAVYMQKYAHSKLMTGKIIEGHFRFMEKCKASAFFFPLSFACRAPATMYMAISPLKGNLMWVTVFYLRYRHLCMQGPLQKSTGHRNKTHLMKENPPETLSCQVLLGLHPYTFLHMGEQKEGRSEGEWERKGQKESRTLFLCQMNECERERFKCSCARWKSEWVWLSESERERKRELSAARVTWTNTREMDNTQDTERYLNFEKRVSVV